MKIVLRRIVAAAAFAAVLALAPQPSRADAPPLDLNTATEADLVALPGVGPAKAKAIVEYRTAHPFQSVEEVKNVRGIGEHLYDSLKDKLAVGAAAKR